MLFMISNSDGDTQIGVYEDEDVFMEAVNAGDFGDDPKFRTDVGTGDPNYWEEDGMYLLIRGAIVTPQAKAKVTRWVLPR